jgi:glutamyl-tRNA reductase
MHIITVGLHYEKTPVTLREQLAFTKEELPEALLALRHTKSILECTIVSTCNRTEVFAVVDQLHTGRHFVKKFLAEWFEVDRDQFTEYLIIREGDNAIRHMFEVAVGLDSMIIGETQILGQMKEAFLKAQEHGATGTIFNTLLKQVVTLAKKAHAHTGIGEHAVSISYAAVELGKKIYGDLHNKSVLLLGAGKMSELTAKHLHENGVADVYVVNRTRDRALTLAKRFNGKAHDFEDLQKCLQHVDIVISSTGAQHIVVTKEMVKQAMETRGSAPLFLIDIAVPRDLDSAIDEVDNAFLYNIDDLEGVVEANIAERRKAAVLIQQMIAEEMDDFHNWLSTLGVVPLINALRQKALSIQEQTMQSIENKLPDLTERERKVLRKHTKSIINQMLRDPILRIKEMAAEPSADEALEMFTNIFALEEELLEQEKVEQAKALASRLERERQKETRKDADGSLETGLKGLAAYL